MQRALGIVLIKAWLGSLDVYDDAKQAILCFNLQCFFVDDVPVSLSMCPSIYLLSIYPSVYLLYL